MALESKREPVEYYLKLKYPIKITQSDVGGYVAEIEELPGCFTQGETLEEVYKNMEKARRLWIEVAFEDGQDIPLPDDEQSYSGKFIVRGPKSLHRKLEKLATREGVSFNQYTVATLSHAVGLEEGRRSKPRKSKVTK